MKAFYTLHDDACRWRYRSSCSSYDAARRDWALRKERASGSVAVEIWWRIFY